MKKITLSLMASLALTSMSLHADDDEALTVSVKGLTLQAAQQIAQASVDACRKEGIQIGVTVVDRAGIPQVALRDSIAAAITLPISKGKAYAAVMFNAPTSQLADRANSPIGRAPGLIMSTGGVPIQVGGALLGAVGVSGAPSGETDAKCALAGIAAVQEDLEMAD